MESWTGIISGTNRGLVFLNFEISEENKIVGTLRFFDAEGITLSGKVEGSIKGNVLEAKLFDFSPRQEGVPTEGTIILTISEDQKEMKGQWRTNIDTQGDCVLYKFSIATKPAMTESNLTLETKDISIFFCSFNKKHIEDIIKIMTEIAKSIREGKESDILPPIYSITYDKEERVRTYLIEKFFDKFNKADKIWYIGFELRDNNNLKKIFINLYYQQNIATSLRSNVLVEDTESEIVTMVPEMVRGLVSKSKNKHSFFHHWLFEATIQILGVVTMLAFAFFVSTKLVLSFPNQLGDKDIYIFVVILIVLSNLWAYSERVPKNWTVV